MRTELNSGLIIIGNEILSGRTLDKNTQHLAQTLNNIGIDLLEVRVVPDIEEEIILAVNALRKKYKYVFTTGGIGPTHDDITAEAIAKAFGTKLSLDKEAYDVLVKYYGGEENLNSGRIKMCMLPEGAEKIVNTVTAAPGFRMENVFVMAGVPKIMQAMLEAVIPFLEKGIVTISKTLRVESPESQIAEIMTDIQNKYQSVSIGSYPFLAGENYSHAGVHVVFRAKNLSEIDKAIFDIKNELSNAKINFVEI